MILVLWIYVHFTRSIRSSLSLSRQSQSLQWDDSKKERGAVLTGDSEGNYFWAPESSTSAILSEETKLET